MLACALLLDAAWAQQAEDLDLITPDGQKQMLANPGTEPVGARQAGCDHRRILRLQLSLLQDGWCPTLQALLAQDPKVAIIYKDWPMLGPVSMYAAASALAAGWQGKYLVAHDALISGPRLAQNDQVDAILQKAGREHGCA